MNYEQKYKKYKLKYLYALHGGASEAVLVKKITAKEEEKTSKEQQINDHKTKIKDTEKELDRLNEQLRNFVQENNSIDDELNSLKRELTELRAKIENDKILAEEALKKKEEDRKLGEVPPDWFGPRVKAIFKPDAITTVFPSDLLVAEPIPPIDVKYQYRMFDIRRPDGTEAPNSEWIDMRTDLWAGHSDFCCKLPPGSMKVAVRAIHTKTGANSKQFPENGYSFLVKGA